MNTFGEQSPKGRLLRLMRILLDRPYAFTLRELTHTLGTSHSTVKREFTELANAGFVLDRDARDRYAFKEEQPFKQLKALLHFSEEDQLLLEQAIDQIAPTSERARRLKAKLSSLYDYRKLGHSYLRKPYLSKVDILLQAQKEKRQVILEGYRSSNSNNIQTRQVEPFHIKPADDTVQTYDVFKQDLRHFRISRFSRVRLLETSWQHENLHVIRPTDPFRIVDAQQIMVHLRFGVGAYNELTERFPLSLIHIVEAETPGLFDFQCEVNHNFLGLSNFILGNYHLKIEVLEPEELHTHLNMRVKEMNF